MTNIDQVMAPARRFEEQIATYSGVSGLSAQTLSAFSALGDQVAAAMGPARRFEEQIAAAMGPARRFEEQIAAAMGPARRFEEQIATYSGVSGLSAQTLSAFSALGDQVAAAMAPARRFEEQIATYSGVSGLSAQIEEWLAGIDVGQHADWLGEEEATSELPEVTVWRRIAPERRRALVAWVIVSLVLHGANAWTTSNRTFDLYQLIDDQIKAIGLALALAVFLAPRRAN